MMSTWRRVGWGIDICRLFVGSIIIKQYIYCSSLRMVGWGWVDQKIGYFLWAL